MRMVTIAVVGAVLGAGCLPLTFTGPPPPSGGSCHVGTFELDTTQVLSSLNTVLGSVTVAPVAGGNATLTTTATTWVFAGDQSVRITGSTPFGPLDATVGVTFEAVGAYEVVASDTLKFTLGSVSGSAHISGTIGGRAFDWTASLPSSGLDRIYALQGSAKFACSSGAITTLTFSSFRLRF